MSSDAMPYETGNPNDYQWTVEAFDRISAGTMSAEVTVKKGIATVSVSGPCPRCNDEVNFTQVLDAVAGEAPGTLAAAADGTPQPVDDFVEVTATCRCGHEHPDRPKTVTNGCGINFLLDIEVPR